MPLLSSSLPDYTGPYSVGTIDVESGVETRKVHDATFKNGAPAFELETVLFSLYYPAIDNATSSKPNHHWVPRPIPTTSKGYTRAAHISNFATHQLFTGALWTLAGSITIPAAVDVPLHTSPPSLHSTFVGDHLVDDKMVEGTDGWPVIVFSHGMAASRTQYSTYCGELASRGYIVAAIEHRDGSCPASAIMREDGSETVRYHLGLKDLKHNPDFDIAALKMAQTDFRHAEIVETIRVLEGINDGKGAEIFRRNPRSEGVDLHSWTGRLAMHNITIAGHSYGATGVLKSLKGCPKKSLPIGGAILLDPGKSSGPLNPDVDVPVLVVHSNSWSAKHSIFEGRPHFDVVKERTLNVIKRGHAAWFMTSLGTSHPSVTDAPLIQPALLSWTTGSTIPVRKGVEVYVMVSEEFLRFQKTGVRTGLLSQEVSHEKYVEGQRNGELEEKMGEEWQRYWQIHVAPPVD